METKPTFDILGKPAFRREDRRFLTGTGCYVDDIVIPGALHVAFVRSPHAHARILHISVDAARTHAGVAAVVTGHELAQWTTRLRIAPRIEGAVPIEMESLPLTKVRFVGDPVACVVASDRYVAEDAAGLVEVDYEELSPQMTVEAATAAGAVLIDEELSSNLIFQGGFSSGHPRSALGTAARIVETHFLQHRQTHAPIETRGCVACWDEGRQHLTFHTGTQVPHGLRTQLALRLRLAETQVTVISPDVGGGFGQKIALYREELIVAALARALRRPVRWREDRLENLLASCHAREEKVTTRATVTPEGRILALDMAITSDMGAYAFYPPNYMIRVTAMILTGPYKIAHYSYEGRVALTNKCPAGPMRAPMAITGWVMEGTIDAVARELALDPIEVRRINMLTASDLPYMMATGERLVDITPRETLERAVSEMDYGGFRERQTSQRRQGRYLGLGFCAMIESTAYGSGFMKKAGITSSGHEAAWVKIQPSGAVAASCGIASTGNSYETTFAQVVAEGLGIFPEDVAVYLGNTDIAPYGMGSRGSRGAVIGGGALLRASHRLRDKVLVIAAALLGLNTAVGLRLRGGAIETLTDGAWRATAIRISDVARTAYLDPGLLPPGVEPGLEAHAAYDPPPMTYSNATHACEVEVDVTTGAIAIKRYIVVDDSGTVINPAIVDGQMHGAIAMGISGVLLEEVHYDSQGQNLSGSFADYRLATASELPAFEIFHQHTPNRETLAGIKGMAEGGVMGAGGALCNAVSDALAPFSITVDRQPLTLGRIRDWLRASGRN